MFDALKSLFKSAAEADYQQLLKQGGIIVDVRSKAEFAGGHITGSINIPVDQLTQHVNRLRSKEQPIITCCASGMRSGAAKSKLEAMGYTNVHNGGGWTSLKQKLS